MKLPRTGTLGNVIRTTCLAALRAHKGSVVRAAAELGLSYSTLYKWLREWERAGLVKAEVKGRSYRAA